MIYLSVTTRIVIGQFSGPYSTARPLKLKLFLLRQFFVISRQTFLAFISNLTFNTLFTLNRVSSRGNDLTS